MTGGVDLKEKQDVIGLRMVRRIRRHEWTPRRPLGGVFSPETCNVIVDMVL
jgi:hypothetical protein